MLLARAALALHLLLLSVAPLAAEEGWISIGPEVGYVSALAASPLRPAIVYAGLEGLGLYRSLDRGQTWAPAGLTGERFYDLAVDPTNPATVIAATSNALFKSTDRGVTFDLLSERPGIQALSFVPGQPGVLLAGAPNGLWKSADGGRSWRPLGASPGRITALAIDPRQPRVLYAGLASGGLFRSTDGGLTWRRRRPGQGRPVTALAIDPVEPSIVYAGVGGELLRSLDRGATWERVGASLAGQAGTALAATRSALLVGTSWGLFRSADRGLTFEASHEGFPPPVIVDLEIDRQDPPGLYARVGGVLLKTTDRGGSWQVLGPPKSLDDPRFITSPSMAVARDGSGTVYFSEDRTLARSTDGGLTWTYSEHPCLLFSSLLVDPRESSHVYAYGRGLAGCSRVPFALFHSLDGGRTWSQRLGLDWLLAAVDPFDASLYAQHTTSGDLWRYPAGSSTPELLVPRFEVWGFAASPRVPGTLWVGRPGEVGRSTDGGRTWSFSSAGLPAEAPVLHLVPDPDDPATVYAGTPIGVFASSDAGATWSPVGSWPEGVFLYGLVLDPSEPSILYAATDSAGVLLFDQED